MALSYKKYRGHINVGEVLTDFLWQMCLLLQPLLHQPDRLAHPSLIPPKRCSNTIHHFLARRWKNHGGERWDQRLVE